MARKLQGALAAIVFLPLLLGNDRGGCFPEPIEPVTPESNLTYDQSCDDYRDVVEDAVAYVHAHRDRMTYHEDLLDSALMGIGPSITLKCIASDEFTGTPGGFGLTRYWADGSLDVSLNTDSVLSYMWYHAFFERPDLDGTAVFAAGILAHELTHVVDFWGLDVPCSAEYNCDRNQYQLWQAGTFFSHLVSCWDDTSRGCHQGSDEHVEQVGEFLDCLIP